MGENSKKLELKKRLSFCITCKDRLDHLKQTLGRNLSDNAEDRRDIEFVLVDFATLGLTEYIQATFPTELADGYLRYFSSAALPYWSAPVAKNTSHVLARGDILANLDADNYTQYRGGRFILSVFDQYGGDVLFHFRKPDGRYQGTSGRIAVSRTAFRELGGYNQALLPVGFDDLDFVHRFRAKWPRKPSVVFASGQKAPPKSATAIATAGTVVQQERQGRNVSILFPPVGAPSVLSHTDSRRVGNTDPKFAQLMWNAAHCKNWMNRQNRARSRRDIRNKHFTSNTRCAYLGVDPLSVREPFPLCATPRTAAVKKEKAAAHHKPKIPPSAQTRSTKQDTKRNNRVTQQKTPQKTPQKTHRKDL